MKRNTNDDGYADIAKPLTLTGTADGKFHEYVVQFPDTLRTYNILRLRIVFHKIASYTTMDIDYIRLSNVKTMTTPKPTVVKTPTPTITPKPTPKPPTPTPPAGCSYQPQCQSREETDCPVVLVCPQTSITIAPILAIAKTGTVVQDNLEGTSGYKLVVTTTETYRLEAVQDGGAQGGRNPTTTQSSIMEQIRANVGKTVTVTGSLRVGGKPPPGGMNIPTDPTMSTIFVQSIVVL